MIAEGTLDSRAKRRKPKAPSTHSRVGSRLVSACIDLRFLGVER